MGASNPEKALFTLENLPFADIISTSSPFAVGISPRGYSPGDHMNGRGFLPHIIGMMG
jgi:hypothetical protein